MNMAATAPISLASSTEFLSRDTASVHELAVGQGFPASPAPHLTARQLDVLALLCEGLPNKLICRRLNIAAGTCKAHISNILRELSVGSRLQAVIVARGLRLVPDPVDAVANGTERTATLYALPTAGHFGQVSESDQMLRAQPHA